MDFILLLVSLGICFNGCPWCDTYTAAVNSVATKIYILIFLVMTTQVVFTPLIPQSVLQRASLWTLLIYEKWNFWVLGYVNINLIKYDTFLQNGPLQYILHQN